MFLFNQSLFIVTDNILHFQEVSMPSTSADKPKDINFTDIVVDISFHPTKDVIASSTIEGDVFL